MGRPKGQQGFGGRPKGSVNKITKAIREGSRSTRDTIQHMVDSMINEFDHQYIQLTAKEKLEVLIKLLPFVVPKLESIKHEDMVGNTIGEVKVIVLGSNRI